MTRDKEETDKICKISGMDGNNVDDSHHFEESSDPCDSDNNSESPHLSSVEINTTPDSEQDIIKNIANVYAHKLYYKMSIRDLRSVLDNAGVQYRVKANKSQLLLLAIENNLKNELTGQLLYSSTSSWARSLIEIINEKTNGYYGFGKDLFFRRFGNELTTSGDLWRDTSFDEFTVDKLIDFFIHLNDPDVTLNKQRENLFMLDNYADRNFANAGNLLFDLVLNKPMWFIGKSIQQIYSKEKDKFVSLNFISSQIFQDEHAFSGELGRGSARMPYDKIKSFCMNNLAEQSHIDYFKKLLDALATANDLIYLTENNPKNVELSLIQKIAEKIKPLSQTYGWRDEIPNWKELEAFFGFSRNNLWKKTHVMKKTLYRIFSENDLAKFSDRLSQELAPLDPASCRELLIEIGSYDIAARKEELKYLFPSYDSWILYEYKKIHGDVDSVHLKDWQKKREGILGASVAYLQDFKVNGIDYRFDAITGYMYRIDETYISSGGRSISAWILHHIDHDKNNNHPNNLLWVRYDSHVTNLNDAELREWIALGKMIKSSLVFGQAPKNWAHENQVSFYNLILSQPRCFINP